MSFWLSRAGSFLEQRVVVEENADVVEDLVELARRRVQDEIGRDANL